jgi:hypothetical protein
VRSCEALRADDPSLRDEDLEKLAVLEGLRYLDLSRTNVTGFGLEFLTRLNSLEVLRLSRTRVGNAGLAHLMRFENLTDLDLGFTAVSDLDQVDSEAAGDDMIHANSRGLGRLAALKRLHRLHLRGTGVHGIGLRGLERCENLHGLDLSATAINPGGIVTLRTLTGLRRLSLADTATTLWPDEDGITPLRQLESLNLSGSWVTDEELARFAHHPARPVFPQLTRLDLSRTRVTDAGLVMLDAFPALREVALTGARVTPKGVASLQAREGLRVLADL